MSDAAVTAAPAPAESANKATPKPAGVAYPEMRVNRDLLDAKFEGYKLALDQTPVAQLSLPCPVDNPQLTERQYSFDHLKAYCVQNHLYPDPWDLDCVYYVDADWRINRVRVVVDSNPDPPRPTLHLPNAADRRLLAGRCQPSLAFADEAGVCVADGCGRLFVVDTGERGCGDGGGGYGDGEWEAADTFEVEPGLLVYAKRVGGPQGALHCLLMRVREASASASATAATTTQSSTSNNGELFRCVLDWLTYEVAESGGYRETRRRTLESACVPNYACFDADCRYLLLACDRPFEFVGGSGGGGGGGGDGGGGGGDGAKEKEAGQEAPSAPSFSSMTSEMAPAPYSWSQTADALTVYIPLPPGAGKSDIRVDNTGAKLCVAIHDLSVLDGPLFEPVDKDACTWTVDSASHLLELHLEGKRTPAWPCLVTNDARGSQLPNAEAAASAAAAAVDVDVNTAGQLYNSQELEECDFPDAGSGEDGGAASAAMVWMDGESQRMVAHTALDSAQWLFSTRVAPNEPPYACLRRDVDGLLWRPDAAPSPSWEHVATFHAFGYVRASKTDAKFVACSPSFGYCAVCDCYRHVYIYHSPRPIEAGQQLRNRRSGQVVSERATQQMISLATQDPLIGFVCCDTRILVLAERSLYVLRICPAN